MRAISEGYGDVAAAEEPDLLFLVKPDQVLL
jgi:hypothetical protein